MAQNCDRRKSYSAAFKLKVIKEAEDSDSSKAARKFSLNQSMVSRWRQSKAKLSSCLKTRKAFRGNSNKFPLLEKELANWVEDSRAQGFIISRPMIRVQALKLKRLPQHMHQAELSTFTASAGWCTRFMNRYGLVLRVRTKIAQKLPRELETKVMSFQRHTITLRKWNRYALQHMGSMDETPLTFDMSANKTVDKCGTKTVLVKTTGHEKLGLTCVLAVTADGAKLPPLIVFKRKKIPASMRFVPGVIVRANEKGWMDSDLTREWLHRVWNKRPGASICKRSMLVWDSFRAHLTQENKDAAENIKTDLNVIPGGLTSILSPLDVAINKPFKDRMKEQWAEWMFSGKARKTAGGNLAKPDLQLVVKWVKEAWDPIPVEVVKKSFLKCGISNELDGTEDPLLI